MAMENNIKQQLIANYQKQILDIKALEERECEKIRQKVFKEEIAPFNLELDQKRANAEMELAQKLKENKAILDQQFEEEKKRMFEKAEETKSANQSRVLTSATCEITTACEKQISKIKALIEDLDK